MNNSSEQLIGKNPRIEAVDALRGFAVMAIVLVHNLEHFIFPVYPADSPGWLNTLDQGVFNVVFTLFAGKAYAIFALLFGFTFYIQSHNLKRRGGDFGCRFLWRLVLLAGFATLNAAFSRPGCPAAVRHRGARPVFYAQLERRGYPRRRRRFPVAACRMVPLHSRPAESGPPVARSGGR